MRKLVCAGVIVLLSGVCFAQEKTVPIPPNVKVEGMPPIPQSILDGVARYGQFRQAQMIAWHPTKRQILIATSLGATPEFHLVDGPGKDRHQLTWITSPPLSLVPTALFDPADGNTFVFQYDPGGSELRSLYKYDMATGETSLVVDAKARYGLAWARQGKWLAYDSAERNGRDRDLYVIQPSDPKTKRRLGDFDAGFSPHDWSPDGTTLVANQIISNSETHLWRVNVKTGDKTELTPKDGEKAGWFNARFSADGKKVYAISDRNGGDFRIWRCDVANGVWSPVTADGVVVDSPARQGDKFEISSDGSILAVVVDKGSFTELQTIDLTTLKAKPVVGLPRGLITQLRWRPGTREVAFTLASTSTQGDVYSVDTSLGTVTRWTNSETTFNADTLPAPEIVEWKSFDGLTISGILYRPAAKFTGPRPVLVNIHGGPDDRERARFLGRSNYFLNELGVAIIYPNVRGSIGFGRQFEQLDNGAKRGDVVKDIGALLDWIAGRPEFDKSRVVLLGASSGGWLALQAGAAYNDRIRGVIEGAGITDFVTFLEQTDPTRQDGRRGEYGDERDPQMRQILQSLSPVTHAAELKKPTLVIHPGKDARVPVSQAEELVKALRTNNSQVWYLVFTNANHDNLGPVGGDYLLATWMWFFQNFVFNDAPQTAR